MERYKWKYRDLAGRIICVIYLILHLGVKSFSQEIPFKVSHIGTTDGLSQGSVYAILRDSRGWMWFGTQDGLNVMKGQKLQSFFPEHKNPLSIAGSKINSIREDNEKNIWIGTEAGLSKYDYEKNTFSNYFTKDEVSVLGITDEHIWLFSSNKGFLKLDLQNLKYVVFFKDHNFTFNYHNSYNSSQIISENEYWIHLDEGVLHLKDGKKTHYFNLDSQEGPKTDITKIKWYDKKLYVATNQGFKVINGNKLETIDIINGIKIGRVIDFDIDIEGQLWVCTSNKGVLMLDLKTNKSLQISKKTAYKPGIWDNQTSAVYADKIGNIWVNSDPFGIDKIEFLEGNFNHLTIEFPSDIPMGQRNQSIRCITEMGNSLYLGTIMSGLWEYDKNTHKINKYYINQGDNKVLPSNFILNLKPTSDGSLWIATEKGLARLKKGKIEKITLPSFRKSITGNLTRHIELFNNRLFISTEEGFVCYDLEQEKFINGRTFSDSRMTITKHLSENKYFAGFIEGGLKLVENGISTTVLEQEIPLFIKANGDNFWVGTNLGLFLINAKGETIEKLDVSNGLPNNYIYCGELDDKKRLWLSSNRGLIFYDPHQKRINAFNLHDGLQDYEYNAFASYKSESGKMYFGGINGLNHFYPSDIDIPKKLENNILKNGMKSLTPQNFKVFLSNTDEYDKPDIISQSFTSKFKTLTSGSPNFLYTSGIGWVHFQLRNGSSEKWFLEIENTRLNKFEVWIYEKKREVQYYLGGDDLPIEKYEFKDPNPAFMLNLLENQQYDIFIKANSSRDLKLPIKVWNADSLHEHQSNRKLVWGIFIGFIILISLYNLFLWLTIKDFTYLYYMLYILSFGLFQFSLYGLAYQYFWSNLPINEYAFLMFLYSSYIFITLFTENFLDLKNTVKIWPFIRNGILIYCGALIITTPFWHPTETNYFAIAMSIFLTSLFYYFCYVFIKKRDKIIVYYAIAVFFLTSASIILAMQNLGLVSARNQEYVLMIGSMFEIVLFSLALGYKFRQNYLERLREQRIRNEISSNLHDNLAASLSSLTMYTELSKRKIGNDESEAKERFELISSKSRAILAKVREAVYELNPVNDNEEDWLFRIINFGKEIFEAQGTDFEAIIPSDFNPEKLKTNLRRDVVYLFKEAMNNSAKYAKSTNVTFSVQITGNDQHTFRLTDNGIGFIVDSVKNGNGLANMEERSKKMNALLKISSIIGKGTTIELIA